MNGLGYITGALNYLEAHMDDEIDMGEVARIACSSPFHFQRMFHMLTGVTVAEYVRKRRLTLAAQELALTAVRVIDVAFKYGYDTPEAFCKAFRKAHGITPTEARRPAARLKAFPQISFQLSLKGDQAMDYCIMEKPAFSVVGKAIRVSTKDGENMRAITEFWHASNSDGTAQQLAKQTSAGTVTGDALLGICTEFQYDLQELTYLIAAEGASAEDGLVEKTIPSATWAVFESVGAMPDAIQKLWGRIFSEFFPSTGFEHAEGGAELEVYPPGNPYADDYRCAVWIPVVKKA